jgi:hypothetical protein
MSDYGEGLVNTHNRKTETQVSDYGEGLVDTHGRKTEASAKSAEMPKLVYSRELYEKILSLMEEYQKKATSLKTDHDNHRASWDANKNGPLRDQSFKKWSKDIDDDFDAFSRAESDLKRIEPLITDQQEKLRILYELAHDEAMRENDKHNLKKLQADWEWVTAADHILERFNPDRIPTSTEQAELEEQYSKRVRSLVDGVAEFLQKNPVK